MRYDARVAIPGLTPDGLLPPGLHRATCDEIAKRFCVGSGTRQDMEAPLRELVVAARNAGACALYLNGSFVSDKAHPGDIDAVIVLPRSFDTSGEPALRITQIHRRYGFDIERVPEDDTETLTYLLSDFFAFDRRKRRRGLIEVVL